VNDVSNIYKAMKAISTESQPVLANPDVISLGTNVANSAQPTFQNVLSSMDSIYAGAKEVRCLGNKFIPIEF